jgi:hypothetical protein
MRKLCLVLLACFLAGGSLEARKSSGQTRFEQNPWHKSMDGKEMDVSANVGGLAWGIANIDFEHALGSQNSWTIGADLGARGYSGWSYTAFGAHGSYRWWWLEQHALQGLYAGPRAGVISYNYSYDWVDPTTFGKTTETLNATGVEVGGEVGYQFIFNNGFLLRGGGELNYVLGSVSAKSGAPTLTGFGLVPNALVSVGYAWR